MKKQRKKEKSPRSDELNRIIRTAALSISENASIDDLARKARVSGMSIRRAIKLDRFSVGIASALELAVGREYIKREVLCPAITADS